MENGSMLQFCKIYFIVDFNYLKFSLFVVMNKQLSINLALKTPIFDNGNCFYNNYYINIIYTYKNIYSVYISKRDISE